MRQLTANEVEFIIECHPEEAQIEGNASAIDPETDAATEEWIRGHLRNGNQWAWCAVIVRAKWKDFEAHDYLGCCSYESEQAFREGPYFDDMKETALDLLNERVEEAAEQLAELVE